MADTKITALAAITTVDPAADVLPIVDISDTSMAASGTTKKITSNQILGAGGTATLASATITGDLTVATDRLKVVTGSTAIQTGATTQLQVGTTSWPSTVVGKSGSRSLFGNTGEVVIWNEAAPVIGNYSTLFVTAKTGAGATTMGGLQIRAGIENASNSDGFVSLWTSNSVAGGFVERYKIDSTGVSTWSVAGTTAMTINSTGLGVGVVPSVGKGALQLSSGINFPATQVASSDVNTLDDYEEGTWTPTVTATAGTLTTTTVNAAAYTKIGRLVSLQVDISIVNIGTASGLLVFSLPTGLNQVTDANVGVLRELGATGQMGQMIYQSATQVAVALYNNGTMIVNGYRFRGTYTYTAAT